VVRIFWGGIKMPNAKLRKIITFAIEKEIGAYEFYHNASKKITSDKNLIKTFEDLAVEESKHRKFLEDFLNGELHEFHLADVPDYHVSEGVEKPELSTEMKFVDAIALAMKNEEEAMTMYADLANASQDASQKELFDELAKMEAMHKARLEDIYVNAAFTEIW
jgi:rubrerythrin